MNPFKKKSFESIKNVSKNSGLQKTLTAFDLVLFGLGALIGTGVFALTGVIAAQYTGPAITVAYLIAGGTSIFIALAYTELASMLPTSGGIYTYTYVAFGEICAWVIASIILIELGFTAATVASSWSAYVQGVLESGGYGLPHYLVNTPSNGGVVNIPALFIILIIGYALYLGTKDSKVLNNVLVIVKITAIMIFIFSAVQHIEISNWHDYVPKGWDNVIRGSSILFFSFTGFGILATTAEECKNPTRDVTIGIIGSIVIATILYVIVGAILTGIVPYTELNTPNAISKALTMRGNNICSTIIAIGAICGMTTVIMMNIYGQSRIFYVIARDGLMPRFMTKLHPKNDNPYITIIIFSFVIGLVAAFCPFDILVQLSSMGALINYIVVVLIVVYFRIKLPRMQRPFKCPALFVIAPIALTSSMILLFKQIINDGKLLVTGSIIIYWISSAFILYIIVMFIVNRNKVNH